MSHSETYQEHEMPNGVYVIENRIGHWMVWAPDDDQPLYVNHNYEMVKLMMKAHSEQKVENSAS